MMNTKTPSYRGYRFPPEIISHAVWLYHRFHLSFWDAEDFLAQHETILSYETIRQFCRNFGTGYARKVRRQQGRLGDIRHVDELFVNFQGQRQYLWRTVAQDSDVIDILAQPRRNQSAAERYFRKLLKG
jgi:putative transposase